MYALSFIVPVYNGERYIKESLNSILQQPCSDYEIIVVDDGSTDRTRAIVDQIAEKRDNITVISQKNRGVSAARNVGIDHAKGEYISFLDADDVLCKDAFDVQLRNTLIESQYDLIDLAYIGGNQKLSRGNTVNVVERTYCPNKCLDELNIYKYPCSFLYKRSLLLKSNLRYPNGICYFEDIMFLFLVLEAAESAIAMNRYWFIYRNNISSTLHSQTMVSKSLCNHVIPGWYWCKAHCKERKTKDLCDIWIFAHVVEYIKTACREGIPLAEIMETLNQDSVKECLNNYDLLWNGPKEIYESFLGNPEKFWKRERRKGIFVQLAKSIVRFPVTRPIYLRIKCRTNIKDYHYTLSH